MRMESMTADRHPEAPGNEADFVVPFQQPGVGNLERLDEVILTMKVNEPALEAVHPDIDLVHGPAGRLQLHGERRLNEASRSMLVRRRTSVVGSESRRRRKVVVVSVVRQRQEGQRAVFSFDRERKTLRRGNRAAVPARRIRSPLLFPALSQ
jgi:hypothetical protein